MDFNDMICRALAHALYSDREIERLSALSRVGVELELRPDRVRAQQSEKTCTSRQLKPQPLNQELGWITI